MPNGYIPPPAVKVWGPLACFTQPGLKTERVSYPVMTPSAARGVLDAIACRPQQMYWSIKFIDVLAPIRFMGVTRNEFQSYPSGDINSIESFDYAAAHTQRHTLFLREVCYVIQAEAVIRPHAARDPHNPNTPLKYHRMLHSRAKHGGCFAQPYLGVSDATCHFCLATAEDSRARIDLNLDLGHMLFDFDRDGAAPNQPPAPVFFKANLVGGRLLVPDDLYARTHAGRRTGVRA